MPSKHQSGKARSQTQVTQTITQSMHGIDATRAGNTLRIKNPDRSFGRANTLIRLLGNKNNCWVFSRIPHIDGYPRASNTPIYALEHQAHFLVLWSTEHAHFSGAPTLVSLFENPTRGLISWTTVLVERLLDNQTHGLIPWSAEHADSS